MRPFRLIARAAVVGAVVTTLTAPIAQGAEETAPKVFGYIGKARATPLAFHYDQPSFGVPAEHTFELNFSHSEAESDSGPSSRALASVLWPGDVVGNAPPGLLVDTFFPVDLIEEVDFENDAWTQIRQGLADGLAQSPPYPIRAEAFYPQDPPQNRYDMGAGISMQAEADKGFAEAVMTGSRGGFPGLVSVGHMNSDAFSGLREGIEVSESHAEVQNISLLGGMFTIEGVTTTIKGVSDGVNATTESSTVITGLRWTSVDSEGDTNHYEVARADDRGVLLGNGKYLDWKEARDFFAPLAENGITVTLLGTQKEDSGAGAERLVRGLAIKMSATAMREYVDMLPEPLHALVTDPGSSPLKPVYDQLPQQATGLLNSFVQYDQSITFMFGVASVEAAASPPFDIPGFDQPPIQPPPVDSGGFAPPPSVIQPPASTDGGTTTTPPATGGGINLVGSVAVPAVLGIIAFVLALFASGGLNLLAERATAPVRRTMVH